MKAKEVLDGLEKAGFDLSDAAYKLVYITQNLRDDELNKRIERHIEKIQEIMKDLEEEKI
jgi:hypothetical protein